MERRMMHRFNLSLRALLTSADGPTRELRTKDISAGGAYFETTDPMPEGTRLFITLFPLPHSDSRPDRQQVEGLNGEVRRRSLHGMAVTFDTIHHFEAAA